ncbi:MAG: SRPBCC family protein [Sporichthyaceae bacterium]
MDERRHSESIVVACSPQSLYEMVSDVTRMGEWSPVCRECWWDEGDGPREGAWFTGRNELDGRIWETRSLVVAADPGREFAYNVLGNWVRWGFALAPVDGGTELTESWQFLDGGVAGYIERWGGDQWQARFAERRQTMLEGIPTTLAAIKAAAEAR